MWDPGGNWWKDSYLWGPWRCFGDKDTHKRGVIFNEGDVMSSFFFEVGLRVNANANIHRMDTVMIEGVAGDRHYVLQQDGAFAHDANKTQV